MKRALRPAFLALHVLALASGCTASHGTDAGVDGGDPGPYADLQWQVRCDAIGMCVEMPARSVLGFDGEGGQRISCTVVDSATDRTLSFDTRASAVGTTFGLALSNARFPSGSGGAPAPGCTVSVTEGSTVLTGACGPDAPSEAQPCQLTEVTFGDDGEGRSLIQGKILCVGLSPPDVPTIDREVTAPGSSATTEPLVFDFYACDGFTP